MLAPVIPLALASLPDQAHLLDAGCGTGILLDRLHAQRGDLRLWGTDGSQAMLEQAHARLGDRAHLMTWELDESAPQAIRAAAPFDVITCTNVLHYLRVPARTITAFVHLLRPGGRLILADFTVTGRWWWVLEGILRLADRQHWQTLTPDEIGHFVIAAGLQVRTTRAIAAGFPWRGVVVEGIRPPSDADRR
jgi:2-polyprenyl-3-methyl-5-hydroxy-6-metoxy-1,4-benzoquinol methylase